MTRSSTFDDLVCDFLEEEDAKEDAEEAEEISPAAGWRTPRRVIRESLWQPTASAVKFECELCDERGAQFHVCGYT